MRSSPDISLIAARMKAVHPTPSTRHGATAGRSSTTGWVRRQLLLLPLKRHPPCRYACRRVDVQVNDVPCAVGRSPHSLNKGAGRSRRSAGTTTLRWRCSPTAGRETFLPKYACRTSSCQHSNNRPSDRVIGGGGFGQPVNGPLHDPCKALTKVAAYSLTITSSRLYPRQSLCDAVMSNCPSPKAAA